LDELRGHTALTPMVYMGTTAILEAGVNTMLNKEERWHAAVAGGFAALGMNLAEFNYLRMGHLGVWGAVGGLAMNRCRKWVEERRTVEDDIKELSQASRAAAAAAAVAQQAAVAAAAGNGGAAAPAGRRADVK
jgi:hypothetical protein